MRVLVAASLFMTIGAHAASHPDWERSCYAGLETLKHELRGAAGPASTASITARKKEVQLEFLSGPHADAEHWTITVRPGNATDNAFWNTTHQALKDASGLLRTDAQGYALSLHTGTIRMRRQIDITVVYPEQRATPNVSLTHAEDLLTDCASGTTTASRSTR